MAQQRKLLVLDPIAFPGGSKIATENILRCIDTTQLKIIVISSDNQSWRWDGLHSVRLHEPSMLANKEQGLAYFLRHFIILLNLLWLRIRFGRFQMALGASGPGVDLALYLARPLLGWKIIQLIHGPVAHSRTIGRCLNNSHQTHYLPTSHASLLSALERIMSPAKAQQTLRGRGFQVLHNGLPAHAWPSLCQIEKPVVYWAASLLKWKGLDHLLAALCAIPPEQRPEAHICYIRPKETRLPVSEITTTPLNIHWHERPENLDEIRANSNIFISTSKAEPFGLSILEAMAAGHCILIPADGAYWDHLLTDGHHCIKYRPGDASDLSTKLLAISRDSERRNRLGQAARRVAENYRAEKNYANIVAELQGKSIPKVAQVGTTTPA
ncbi:MAG: glycosyltransferase family 4 protein [Sedimenticola sp.]